MKILTSLIIIALCVVGPLKSQNLIWSGEADKDFFNEANWLIEGTENNPDDGSIDVGAAIAFNLMIGDETLTLSSETDLAFSSTDLGLTISNTQLELGSVSTGYIKTTNASTLILNAETPIGAQASLDLFDNHSWVKLINVDPVDADANCISKVESDGNTLTSGDNVFINQYYFGGSLLRLKDPNSDALTLFSGSSQSGDAFGVPFNEIYSDNELGGFNNKASSFRLERGYMATMAIFQNGTGKSEVFIASEEALELDLPASLDNTVSFVRVVPWNWVTKKGASKFEEIGTTWTYNWNRNGESLLNIEYAPMSWGSGGASLSSVAEYIKKENVTHLMGFNESDNCNGQSGQFNGLCQIDIAVPLFRNLMRAGLRLVSPSPRENGPLNNNWLVQFRDEAIDSDIRYDVLGVHWYDWGSNPVNSPFADPQDVFERFKNYLTNVYDKHKMPIWITEFNANANRDISVQVGFLELALPYLESLDYIERYDYFEPSPDVANNREDITFGAFYDENDNITELGLLYRDFESGPSIPEATYAGSTFLSGLDEKVELTMEISKTELNEGESLTISFTTNRSVAAPESFNVEVNLDDTQFTLGAELIEIPEGGKSAEVTLSAVDDDLVEDLMNGTISLVNLSSGIAWSDNPVSFSIASEDEEVEEVILSVIDGDFALTIYPNPTKRFIKLASLKKVSDLQLITVEGKHVDQVEYNGGNLDMLHVEAGLYVLRVIFDNGEFSNALIRKI